MKELSIEEKAKRYDEAIEIAKEINNEQRAQPFDVMTRVFPELKESKDERIRKALLAFCKNRAEKYSNDPKYKNISAWIAWLEKQDKTFTKKDVDDAYLKGISDAKNELEKQGEQKDPCENCEHQMLNCQNFPCDKKQNKQKIADKSDSVLDILNKENQQVQQEDLIMKPSLEILGENEMILNEVISILDNGFMPSSWERARLANGLQSIKLQSNPAWSKEDEEMYKEVLTDIIYAKNDLEAKECLGLSKRAMEAFNWFSKRYKSLRPQNRWKPSDEQMEALWNVYQGGKEQAELAILYNDLKKLKK